MGDMADDAMSGMYDDEYFEMLFREGKRRQRKSILEDFAQPMKGTTVTTIRETAEAQLQRNEAERQRLLTRLAVLDKFGADDPWEDETVLIFRRDFGGPRSYGYVAVRMGGTWYVTGARNANRAFTWEELVEEHLAKIVPDSLYVAGEWIRYDHVD